jgi:trehalose 6-phosphate synthase/phosphatase
MRRLLIVSNRLPIKVQKKKGKLLFQQSVGGLTTGLSSFYKSYDSMWVGWCEFFSHKIDSNDKKYVEEKLKKEFSIHPVALSKKDVDMYYLGFSNKTIWPLFHYFIQYTLHDNNLWESYKHVNGLFCNEVLKVAKDEDIIWIHDYHLMLLPKLIREKLPNATIGFFLHIPFPAFEIFRLLPWRREILNGLLGSDLIGFHIYDYVQHFLDSARRLLGYENTLGQITSDDRIIKVDAFPMGIDYERFSNGVQKPEVQKEVNSLRKKIGDRKLILSVDRLDYTKGILQRLEAFDYFLQKYPKYKEKLTLILIASPSRTPVPQYRQLKRHVDEHIGKINGKHGTIGWIPIWYLYRSLNFDELVAVYSISDIALVTALRDGMNLIAKEFIATKIDGKGVLILSEMAGAAAELGEAILVNANHREEVVEALKAAIEMPEEEQKERNHAMQERLKKYNLERWAHDFMDILMDVKKQQLELTARKLTKIIKDKLISQYLKSRNSLILLDYDGTLMPFAARPEKAMPDNEILNIIKEFTKNVNREIVIVSGRDRKTLDRWFHSVNVSLIAEHGTWLKSKGKKWKIIEPLQNDWKEEIRPILQYYADRTTGSLIEEKDFSLVWHYRRVDPELASVRAWELKDSLMHFTANLNLEVLEGNKVIEIKNVGINKGRAVLRWISKRKWDFILALGDDWTDEDLFAVLPKSAYSIKVGLAPSQAKYNLDSVAEVRSLLKEMMR